MPGIPCGRCPGGPVKDRGSVGVAGAGGPCLSGHKLWFQVPAPISEGSVRPRCPAARRAGGSLSRGRAAEAGSPRNRASQPPPLVCVCVVCVRESEESWGWADGGGVAAWEDGREGGGGIEGERGPGACDW